MGIVRIDNHFTEQEQKIIDIWGELYTAFNHICKDGEKWIITGGDYDDAEFDTKEELMKCIEYDTKEALLCFAMNGELSELNL